MKAWWRLEALQVRPVAAYWKPYLDVLPPRDSSNFGPTPDFWSNEDISKLELPQMIDMAMERKSNMEALAKDKSISLDELQIATWLVNSRGITLVDNQDNEEIDDEMIAEYLHEESDNTEGEEDSFSTTCVLIPLLDMINHSSKNFNTYLTVLGDGESEDDGDEGELFYAVIARRDIPKGEELLISYGSKEDTSLELLLHYGFVPDDNPYDLNFMAWNAAEEDEMANCWSTTLQQDQEQLQSLRASEASEIDVEETILKFRIRMKKACEEYNEIVESGTE
ncbi:MAG: hypothetical protein SGARI_000722 [Bacillariaceae sp.]